MADTATDDRIAKLVDSLRIRSAGTRWGIGTAAQYLKSVEGCLYGDLFTVDEWRKAVKAAEGRLTYCDEEMGDAAAICKSVNDNDVPDGFLMTFDCTLTSCRRDRDGDILEPGGLKVDENMPLLWQHLPMQPIGRLLDVTEKSDDRIRAKFGIVDTALGRDAAVLTKAGALRMSHGFKPYEFDPIYKESDSEKSGPPAGWHVKSGEIREGSQVSIPSNVDGVIEAYSQGGLTTPLVKSWAKAYYDTRPLQVPVNIDLSVKVNGQELGATVEQQSEDADEDIATKEAALPDEDTSDADDSGGPQSKATAVEPAPASDDSADEPNEADEKQDETCDEKSEGEEPTAPESPTVDTLLQKMLAVSIVMDTEQAIKALDAARARLGDMLEMLRLQQASDLFDDIERS